MNKELNTTSCSNCKYYKRHYVVHDRGFLIYTHKGHCANPNIKDSVSARHVKKDEGCALWQPLELQKLSIQYGIEQSLQNISDKVNEILAVLRDVE